MRFRKPFPNWQEINDWTRYELKGRVKQMMQAAYSARLENGKPVEDKIVFESGHPDDQCTIDFNEDGNRISEITYTRDGLKKHIFGDKDLETYSEEFDIYGNLKKTTSIVYEGKLLTEYKTTDEKGCLDWLYIKKHNEQGKEIESICYRGEHRNLHHISRRTYDSNGNMLSSIQTDKDGVITDRYEQFYNEKGLKVSETRMHRWMAKETVKRVEYRYNEHNDCVEMTEYDEQGSIVDEHHFTYEYDENGKKIIKPLEEEPNILDDFTYDEKGNWTRLVVRNNKIPLHIFIREYIYFDEADQTKKQLIHPLSDISMRPKEKEASSSYDPALDEDALAWIAEGTSSPDSFSALRFYVKQFEQYPSLLYYNLHGIEAVILLKELKEHLDAKEVFSYSHGYYSSEQVSRYALIFPEYEGYLFYAYSISSKRASNYEIPSTFEIADDDYVHIGQFHLLRPATDTGKRNEKFEGVLNHYLQKCSLQAKREKPFISIIEVRGDQFELSSYPVRDDFTIKDLNVNYGYGFDKFHNEFMSRLANGTKGLALFYGEPGTGKTYYIRHLLRRMASSNKKVIYMPPNLVNHLIDPAFITFLMDEIKEASQSGQYCVLLIEDAEPLLEKREEGTRIQGITNLLNMTDGILNDMLNLQIICTFNMETTKIDEALKREGRLIADKKFSPLSVLDANLLAQRLGIKHTFDRPATLAEIYAKQKDHNTLRHESELNKH